jgi:sec-independent protein translocase protein TatA
MTQMPVVLATLSEWHIILALIIVFLLFGGKKLPELARGIGEAMKEFKKAQRDVHDDHTPSASQTPATSAPDGTTVSNTQQKPTESKLN